MGMITVNCKECCFCKEVYGTRICVLTQEKINNDVTGCYSGIKITK